MDSLQCMTTKNNVEDIKISTNYDARLCSCSSSGAKKRTWESSHTSLKSKKVKRGHMISCQSENGCVSRGNKTTNKENCYKIMFMNIADYAKKSNLTKIIMDLGGSVTSDGRSNHLHRAWVISPTWLKESFREGRFVDEMDYIVKDDEYEVKYRINLNNTVVKARANPIAPIKDWRGTVDSSSGLCNLFF
ncbi:hypothetical protein L2E82_49000 [Cichorium intybus]|uniref:Uncharacterized protein n=1 Tax=Cichorium intybus TaxID=13427 RepID=A0ACB8YZR2_CICIN|nr:hypothetical protein L2E82_49000 [Cichorium intybus]